ncbi:hypothetical protein GY24_04090 [Microterricola pindariensis]|uniref:Uncharacterized protein n=2 Tax=Microterricola pindariensis TaxID=478010 RepID=A0ABX5AZ47_9MICO|nr:hypothetical protein GY24_04090 [Microterricola pindariensis]
MIGRDRAADMLEEAKLAGPRVGVPSEQEAVAAAAARAALAVKVLSAFSSDEMMAEIRRRKMSDE